MPDAGLVGLGVRCNELGVLLEGHLTVEVDLADAACADIVITMFSLTLIRGFYE